MAGLLRCTLNHALIVGGDETLEREEAGGWGKISLGNKDRWGVEGRMESRMGGRGREPREGALKTTKPKFLGHGTGQCQQLSHDLTFNRHEHTSVKVLFNSWSTAYHLR